MDTGAYSYTLVDKISRLRYTALMIVTGYSVFAGRISGGFSEIESTLGISPQTYAVWMMLAAIIWTIRVLYGYRADGFTLTPLLLYYTMAVYAILSTPGVPFAPVAAYAFIASEMIKLILSNQGNYYAARSPIAAATRDGGYHP